MVFVKAHIAASSKAWIKEKTFSEIRHPLWTWSPISRIPSVHTPVWLLVESRCIL